MTTPFFERLLTCKNPGESNAAFVRRLNLSPSTFQRWQDGDGLPKIQTAARIAEKTGKSPSWLLFGIENHGQTRNQKHEGGPSL